MALLFSEFFALTFGISVLFIKINIFQILFHFVGIVHLTLMVLVRFSYTQMRAILTFYVIIPFLLEISVLFMACGKFKVMSFLQNIKEKRLELLEKEINKRNEDAIKADENENKNNNNNRSN